jgi:uncharacterized protein YggL (DUF469 family)
VSNKQQMYRQHKRMRVGTFLTLALTVAAPFGAR